ADRSTVVRAAGAVAGERHAARPAQADVVGAADAVAGTGAAVLAAQAAVADQAAVLAARRHARNRRARVLRAAAGAAGPRTVLRGRVERGRAVAAAAAAGGHGLHPDAAGGCRERRAEQGRAQGGATHGAPAVQSMAAFSSLNASTVRSCVTSVFHPNPT